MNTANAEFCRHNEHEPEECSIIGDIILNPGEGCRLPLGMYEKPMDQPEFEVSCQVAEADDISASLQRIDDQNEYTLVYFLQNFSNQPKHVIVREQH